jgi:hypothetical protein
MSEYKGEIDKRVRENEVLGRRIDAVWPPGSDGGWTSSIESVLVS